MQTQQLVQAHRERISTTSMVVSGIFGRGHDDVIRDIEGLECSDVFRTQNFEASSYRSAKNEERPFYYISRDGFWRLAMEYSGKKAAHLREAFIAAFNNMENELRLCAPKLLDTYQRRIKSESAKMCPDNRWCVFNYSNDIMLLIENEIGSVSEFDLVDGSIGLHWSKFREGKPWAKTVSHFWYHFEDKRNDVLTRCYEFTELEYFNVWLKRTYKVALLIPYLLSKFKKDKVMLQRVEAFKPKLLGKAA